MNLINDKAHETSSKMTDKGGTAKFTLKEVKILTEW